MSLCEYYYSKNEYTRIAISGRLYCKSLGPNILRVFLSTIMYMQGERDGIWVWQRINQLFNWLPLAAVIEKKIICMHGGIGRSINFVQQIEDLKRPITMEAGSVVLMDLLWSDPTENDSVEGLRPNARGPGLVTFGVSKILILLEHLQRVLLMAHLLGPSSAPTHFAAIDF
jgi:diadenosine tetraphosphatase ApaH/serine/threonine PP2A family protein phosphatase